MSRSLTFSRVEACIDIVELSLLRVDTEFSSRALARSCRPLTPEPYTVFNFSTLFLRSSVACDSSAAVHQNWLISKR